MDPCKIPGNPDIAGIGVRLSIYVPALVAILAVLYTAYRAYQHDLCSACYQGDHEVFAENGRLLSHAGRSLLLTGATLILSAIIEITNGGRTLTTYHLLVVLNLSWVNNVAGCALEVYAMITTLIQNAESGVISLYQRLYTKEVWFVSIHSTVMSIVGIWFWINPTRPLSSSLPDSSLNECIPTTYYWLFVPIKSSNSRLRIISLIAYGMASIPLLSILIHLAPLSLVTFLMCRIVSPSEVVASSLIAVLSVTPIILFILATEMLVALNRPCVEFDVEGSWSYGQTLSFFAALTFAGSTLWRMWRLKQKWQRTRRLQQAQGESHNEDGKEGEAEVPRIV